MPEPTATPAAASSATPAATTNAADPKLAGKTAPVSKAPVATPEETWDVQENGQVVKKTRREIIEAYQLRQLSDKRRSEADKALQEYNKVFETYKQDPVKFMKVTGVDFDNLATSYLARKAEEAMLDPKDLELKKTQAERDEYKKWVEEQKTNLEKATKEKAVQVERDRIHSEIIRAIEESKELGLPVDEELVIAIAQKMLLQDKKQKPLNAKEALPQAYASTQKWLQGMASKMEGEALVKWLGQDVALKIRKYDLGQLRSKKAPLTAQPTSAVKPASTKKEPAKKYKTWSEYAASLEEKVK
jgi:hypothetical protein